MITFNQLFDVVLHAVGKSQLVLVRAGNVSDVFTDVIVVFESLVSSEISFVEMLEGPTNNHHKSSFWLFLIQKNELILCRGKIVIPWRKCFFKSIVLDDKLLLTFLFDKWVHQNIESHHFGNILIESVVSPIVRHEYSRLINLFAFKIDDSNRFSKPLVLITYLTFHRHYLFQCRIQTLCVNLSWKYTISSWLHAHYHEYKLRDLDLICAIISNFLVMDKLLIFIINHQGFQMAFICDEVCENS